MGIYVTINDQNQVGIINENTTPKQEMWFSIEYPSGARDQVITLISALGLARNHLTDKKQSSPRWGVK